MCWNFTAVAGYLSKAAQLLDTSTLDVSRIASEQNLSAGATKVQQEKSR